MALFRAFVDYFILSAYVRGLVPNFMLSTSWRRRLSAKKIFFGRKLVHNPDGYWSVVPMPGVGELNEYYENAYWEQRGGKREGVEKRDLDHCVFLKQNIPDFFSGERRRVVNFGAGHGGISHLLYFQGHSIVNVEPSGSTLNYGDERWVNVRRLEEVDGQVDLIYGSHSLEHVQDVESFERLVHSKLRVGGYVFWEVPNAEHPASGGSNGVILAPHTYYFTVGYFSNLNYQILINASFDQGTFPSTVAESAGPVIRFLGRRHQ